MSIHLPVLSETLIKGFSTWTTGGPQTSARRPVSKGYYLFFKGINTQIDQFWQFPWQNFLWWSANESQNL